MLNDSFTRQYTEGRFQDLEGKANTPIVQTIIETFNTETIREILREIIYRETWKSTNLTPPLDVTITSDMLPGTVSIAWTDMTASPIIYLPAPVAGNRAIVFLTHTVPAGAHLTSQFIIKTHAGSTLYTFGDGAPTLWVEGQEHAWVDLAVYENRGYSSWTVVKTREWLGDPPPGIT